MWAKRWHPFTRQQESRRIVIAKAKVVIVQPYVPTYRVAFFEKLHQRLADKGVECVVAAGVPEGSQKKRADAAIKNWIRPIQRNNIRIKGRTVGLTLSPTPWQGADAVILGLEGTALPVYQALLSRRQNNMRVGLWGHIRPYVSSGNSLDLWAERMQMHAADHIFAYTPGGKGYAEKRGIPSNKITTVMNTVDTTDLADELESVTPAEIRAFKSRHNLDVRRTVCFIGGLDESKRIKFLSEALDYLWIMDPQIKILIGGRGPDSHFLAQACNRGQAIQLGYLDTHDKALILATTRAICMPGRVGLVAVDGLVSKRPIITTDWLYHAPEAEYLEEGVSRITSCNSPYEYAKTIRKYVETKHTAEIHSYPTLQGMVENFSDGVIKMCEL